MNVEVARYIRSTTNYTSLDEYISWDENRSAGGREKDRPKSFLEHLDHVYTFNKGALGPSVFEKILEMVGMQLTLKWI
jgi:hypothetical protein